MSLMHSSVFEWRSGLYIAVCGETRECARE